MNQDFHIGQLLLWTLNSLLAAYSTQNLFDEMILSVAMYVTPKLVIHGMSAVEYTKYYVYSKKVYIFL